MSISGIMTLKKLLAAVRWGEKSIISLYLSLFSGVIVALQYDFHEPYYSVNSLDILIPFGSFWRSLHFYSSQVFFLCCCLHLLVIISDKKYSLEMSKWVLLISTLPLTILLLFTGYVLRGDATGESAGFIAENIALSIPLFGEWVNAIFFSISSDGMKRIFMQHLTGIGLLWLIMCWDHIRRFRVGLGKHNGFLLAIVFFCLFIDAPLEQEKIGTFHISGPWFFIGLQELLRFFQPFSAGIVFPLTFLLALCMVQLDTVWRKRSLLYCGWWLALYSVLTLFGFSR